MSARATASAAQLKALLAEQPGPGIVYVPSRDKAEKLAAQLAADGAAGAALSCRARAAGPRAQPGGVRHLRGDGDGRDHRLRHGHRQAGRPLRRPCRPAQVDRGLLSGNRPRRPRRRAGRGLAVLGRRGFRPRPAADRDRGRGGPPRRRARAAERARQLWSRPRAAAAPSCSAISARTRRPPAAIATIASKPPQAIDATTTAQKLLSAAFRTEMRFGVGHLTDVLAGRETDKVHEFRPPPAQRVRHRRRGRAGAGQARRPRPDRPRRACAPTIMAASPSGPAPGRS